MRYAKARFQQEQRDLAYRIFVTEGIALSVQGKYLTKHYADFVKRAPVDDRPADEIALDILSRAGIEVTKSE